ncbi:MAG: hypothetical protein AB1679_34970 [Actinomycetota bacterium]|jgi:hypothetical protein
MVIPVLAHGGLGGLMEFFPFLFIGAAIFVIVTAMRDGSGKKTNTRTLPTNSLSRQVHFATRRPRSDRATVPNSERLGRRFGAPKLHVMDGESADNRPAIPRRFEPPPPRRKTG